MFGFLKRKKKDDDADPVDHKETQGTDTSKEKPAKKKFSLKLIIIILLVLIAVGASGFVVYKFWFSAPKEGEPVVVVYKKKELPHINLPEEMLEFSFYHFPELYTAFIDFNTEINLIEAEINRINDIAAAYPEQKKIADTQRKVWEKTRDTLKKAFLKIEKPVKETYVLFRVNSEQGLERINEKKQELTESAQSALASADEVTQKLKQIEPVPEGLIKGTIYKIKKKFL